MTSTFHQLFTLDQRFKTRTKPTRSKKPSRTRIPVHHWMRKTRPKAMGDR